MIVYMLRHNTTGKFYRHGGSHQHRRWGPQEKGSIWPSKHGPQNVKGWLDDKTKTEVTLVPFELKETDDPT